MTRLRIHASAVGLVVGASLLWVPPATATYPPTSPGFQFVPAWQPRGDPLP